MVSAPAVATDTATLEQLDPTTLTLNTNVRTDAGLDPLFVESIREHGVLTPVRAHRDGEAVVVDQGQRRTLAAVQAGRTTIPVVVMAHRPDPTSRIVDQLTENQHRAGLGRGDLVAAVDQLSLIGFTPSQIARSVSIPKETATAAVTVARSAVASRHLATMTLEDAAVLAEFEDDPEAVERLERESGFGRGLASTAQRIRDDYAERDAVAAIRAELAGAGLTVLDQPPRYDDTKTQALNSLEGPGKTRRIDPGKHAEQCPGHVVWVRLTWGHGHGSNRTPEVVAGCTGWAEHGHTSIYGSGGGGKVAAADMTEEEREAARAERRHVIESNKDWRAATTVRRRWLREFAQRKAAPAGAEHLIAAAVAEGWSNVEAAYRQKSMWELLGTTPDSVVGELQHATRGRALQISLAVCVAAWEDALDDQAWRSTDYRQKRSARVLEAISQWGHTLSAIEERLVDGTAAEPEPPAEVQP